MERLEISHDTHAVKSSCTTPTASMQPVVGSLQGREGRREQPPSAPANELQRSGVVGLRTGFVDLDRLTGGRPAAPLFSDRLAVAQDIGDAAALVESGPPQCESRLLRQPGRKALATAPPLPAGCRVASNRGA